MKRTIVMLVIIAMLLTLGAVATAAGNGETAYRALLIGVDGYQTNALTGCVNDTGRMSATLQAANEAGAFYQSPVIRSNLQTDEITQVFKEVETWNVDEDDVTFFYFAGHGYMSDKGTPAIVGKDSKMLKITDLKVLLDEVPGVKVVVLDCRYADSLLSKAEEPLRAALAAYDTALIDVFKTADNSASYYVISASTLASSVPAALTAADDARGLITYFLTQACGYDYVEQRPMDDLPADSNDNGAVSLSEARDYIENGIAALPNAAELTYDVQIFPQNSAFPVVARRATSEVLEVRLESKDVSVPVSRTVQLDAITQPANASKRSIYWSSSNLAVATVNDSGLVTGVKPGTARIAATTTNGLTVTADITVTDIRLVESLKLNISRLALAAGSGAKLVATVTPANATEPIAWTSENLSVATVDQQGNVTLVDQGETVIHVTSESGEQASCAISVVDKKRVVNAVAVAKKELDIFIGESRKVQTKVKPANAVDPLVQLSSSDPAIADISGDNIITGVSAGTCTIYATASSGVSSKIEVTVKGATIKLSENSLPLKLNKSTQIKAQVKPSSLAATLQWESSSPQVATVDEKGNVTAVAAGEAIITATVPGNATATCKVVVGGVAVKQIKLTPAKLTIEVNKQHELKVQLKPDNASLDALSWKSGNEKVVQVDDTGVLTAVAAGRAVITVQSFNGAKAKCLVTVKAAAVSSIELSETEATLVAGLPGSNKLTLTAETEPVTAGSGSLKWTSSNPKVATVDKTGVVTARASGKAIIRAKAAGVKNPANVNITVVANQTANKKPITGADATVYTSAKRIQYMKGYLVISLYYTNQTKAAAAVPYDGTLILSLASGEVYPVRDVKAGKNSLKAGKTHAITYKVQVKEGDALYGLDLRGASAQLVRPEDLAADSLTPATQTIDPAETDTTIDTDETPT